jgi:dihydroxyacetone kinase
MAVRDQDFFDGYAVLRDSGLHFGQIAAGIGQSAAHRLRAPDQGAILLQRGNGDHHGLHWGFLGRGVLCHAAAVPQTLDEFKRIIASQKTSAHFLA